MLEPQMQIYPAAFYGKYSLYSNQGNVKLSIPPEIFIEDIALGL
jgi:hypothetical protein